MIRSITTCFLLFFSVQLFSQSLEDIKSLAGKNLWEKARLGMDQFLSSEANKKNPEAWQLKALILYKIASTESLRSLAPSGHSESFQAYKKYLELESKEKTAPPREHEILFGVAFSNIERANNEFQHKRYAEALRAFIEVEEMENFIVKNGMSYQGFSFPAYDTQLYVNIAAAAVSANREDIALKYYQKIADRKIVSKGFDGIYRYLVDRFDRMGDMQARDRYLATGRELYPGDPYWCQVALRDAGGDKRKLLARYDELSKTYCDNYLTQYNYAVETYNYSFRQASRPADFAKVHPRIPGILKKALAHQNTVEANLLMCRYQLLLINDLIDAYNAIKENTPDKVKKKDALTAQINQRYEEVLVYAGTAYDLLESEPALDAAKKENLIMAARMLSDYWERKNDRTKQKLYEDRIKGLE